jgi:signal transduction histidine kinase
VTQILTNLVGNALRFVPERGHVALSAHLVHDVGPAPVRADESLGWSPRQHDAGPWVRISVADDGPGIPEAELGRIFQRRRTGSAAPVNERVPGGSGLGLAIARELVQRQGGEIWADSTPGRGTTFHFTLPVAHPAHR